MDALRRSRLELIRTHSQRERLALAGASLVGLALLGAAGFGLVHVIGGAFYGNPRAIWFGVRLTGASGLTLVAGGLLVHRLERGR